LERGSTTDYLHWQIIIGFIRPIRLAGIKKIFGAIHAELSRSAAADAYVHKEDTAVEGTRFDLGTKPINRKSAKDWESIRDLAKSGNYDQCPADIYVRCYSNLKRIAVDHLKPVATERIIFCFWGDTGTGKSRRAWTEAGLDAYPKIPSTKFWDGYQGQENVIIDEFCGEVGLSHILRWCDRYPVVIEVKGSAMCFTAKRIWFTSNIDPRDWYPDAKPTQVLALLRRMQITHFDKSLVEYGSRHTAPQS